MNLDCCTICLTILFLLLQIHMSHDDITRIQIELVPMLQDTIFELLVIIFFAITPSEPALIEDFNYKLSSLQIGMFMMRLWSNCLPP